MRACGPLFFHAALRSRALRIALALALAPAAAGAQDAERATPSPDEPYLSALSTGELDAREVARMHVALGVIAAMDHTFERADAHFHAAVAIDPAVELTGSIDESVRERFDAIRRGRGGLRIALSAQRVESQIILTVRNVPGDLALQIDVHDNLGGRERIAWRGEPIPIDPAPNAFPIEARLVDAYGNRIETARVDAPRVVLDRIQSGPPPADEEPPEDQTMLDVIVYSAIGVIIVTIVATIVGFTASGDRFLLGPPVVR